MSRHRSLLRPALAVLLGLVALATWATAGASGAGRADSATVRLALDWTPNTNHTGFFVAKSKGFYDAAGIDFKILPYSGTATDTPVANGKAECGINFEDFMTIAV